MSVLIELLNVLLDLWNIVWARLTVLLVDFDLLFETRENLNG